MSDYSHPVAWMHVMDNTEGIEGNEPLRLLTFEETHPFGKAGVDFLESFPVTSTPLYGQETAKLERRIAELTAELANEWRRGVSDAKAAMMEIESMAEDIEAAERRVDRLLST